ncbi:hypothetical protein OAE80_03280 [Planctomycetaceae bacterium]|jgi:hypothetical protein|nr:hypothetical protein [Planctomycetaceae bacterium]
MWSLCRLRGENLLQTQCDCGLIDDELKFAEFCQNHQIPVERVEREKRRLELLLQFQIRKNLAAYIAGLGIPMLSEVGLRKLGIVGGELWLRFLLYFIMFGLVIYLPSMCIGFIVDRKLGREFADD